MKIIRIAILCATITALASSASGYISSSPKPAGELLLILPFQNNSKIPSIEWIGEGFVEVLGKQMESPSLYVIGREDRAYAFDRLGLPATIHPSRATIYRIAEEMDVNYVVMGSYQLDDQTFTARAQLLDVKRLKMSPETSVSGPVTRLLAIQNAVAWELLRVIDPDLPTSRQAFMATSPTIPVEAFKNYIRGVLDTESENRLNHFNQAIRLAPGYSPAILQLGKTYFNRREYRQAASWLEKVAESDPRVPEARFYLGLSAFYQGEYERAQNAFKFVAARIPLTEVINNLGVIEARRGRSAAIAYFRKAVEADPQDPDYQFNLALAEARFGAAESARRHAREAAQLRPADSEAKNLLAQFSDATAVTPSRSGEVRDKRGDISREVTPSAPTRRMPLERIKNNYDETSYHELAMVIENVRESRLAGKDPQTHASEHVTRGQDWLAEGNIGEAQKEFQEAIAVDPANAPAHAGLAATFESKKDISGAIIEARTSLRLAPSAQAYAVLARGDAAENNFKSASENVDRAIALDPANPELQELKRSINAKHAQIEPPSH